VASLHKDPRGKSPFWFVAYRTPDGRQHFKSTRETDRAKAEAFRKAIEEMHGRAKIGACTETAARSIMADLFEAITGDPLKFTTVRAWFDTCLADVKKKRGLTTHARYASVIRDFLKFIGPQRAAAPVESLTSVEIQRFADSRLEEGRAVKTVSNDLKPISSFLNIAERKGLLLKSPMGSVELPESEGETKDAFTEAELSTLLSFLSAATDAEGMPLSATEKSRRRDWLTAVNIGLFTGARLGNCVNMRWSNVDFARHEIRYIPEKNRKKRELKNPLATELEAYLIDLPSSDKADGFLSPSLGGGVAGGRSGLSKEFGAILGAAGIDRRPGLKKSGKGRTVFKLGFHSLRHTCNSMMADGGVSPELRRKLIGHASAEVNEKYTHFSDATKRGAIETIKSVSTAAVRK
jgi:integrase